MPSKKEIETDPFDIYVTFGIVISGQLHDLEILLNDIKATIKSNPKLRLIYTKTTGGKLTLVEKDRGQEYYKNK